MRIGFTGSQGTGKTSVAKALVKKWPDYHFVPSSARRAAESGYKVNRDADPLSQLVTTAARVADEDYAARINQNTVSDRTPLDSLAYTMYQQRYIWKDMTAENYYMQTSAKFVSGHMHKYDAIYYFPVYWLPKVDDVRDGDRFYQEDIDDIIRGLLAEFKIHYVTMPEASVSERVDFISGKRTFKHHYENGLTTLET